MASGDFGRFEVTVEGDALVRDALEAGKGCVLLGSHLGSFDLMMLKNQVLHDRPITVLMHIDERSRVRRIAGIDDSKLPIIPLGRFDSYLRAYEVLERGGLVVALADRSRERGRAAERVSSAGPAPFPVGPHALAARAGASVLMGFGLYEGGASYRIEFVEFGPAAPRRQPRRGAAAGWSTAMRRCSSSTPGAIPKNWFNFFPYWQQQ